jgi:hypothetical protein
MAYLERVEKIAKWLVSSGRFPEAVSEVRVLHDDGCAQQPCDCEPDFELPDGRVFSAVLVDRINEINEPPKEPTE